MSSHGHEAFFIGADERRLFCVYRAPPSGVRAAMVLCPPFFHEQFLSYRLLSLVAARLAERGIASLRFDYFGSGDSAGEESEFSVAGAIADTETALATLAARLPGVARIAFGARAGAWPAAGVAAAHRLPLWLWQPLTEGSLWLDQLERLDVAERASHERYPFMGATIKAPEPDRLLSASCSPALRAEIARQRLADGLAGTNLPVEVIDDADAVPLPDARHTFALPHATAQWHAKIDMKATFVTREVAASIDALAHTIGESVST